jgi:serine/threonine protein kinase
MLCPFCQADSPTAGDSCLECGHALASSASIRRGTLLAGRYEVLTPVGRGGMGMVYKAHDRVLDEVIALKVLRTEVAEDAELAKRFRQEFTLARRVRHRNVCAIYEYGEDGGLRYIGMEFVDGLDLRQLVRRAPLSPAEAFDIAVQSASGLQAIHEVGIIHRDFKSSNIMRTSRGVVRLMDFGIAKTWGSEQTATLAGQVMGTPEYISPEQARGERVDFRSDVYALGVVVFELFTGDVPFRADTPVATIYKHLQDAPPLEGPRATRLPNELRAVLRQALAKDPAQRFPSAAEMADALVAASHEAGAMSTTPWPGGNTRRFATVPLAHDNTPVAKMLAGDLRTMGLGDVLRWIGLGRKTGTLHVQRRSISKRLTFREGALLSSSSNDPRESLGQFLIRERLITEEQLFKALLKQEDQGRLLGAVLVAEAALSEEQLKHCLSVKAAESLYDLFLWPEGTFEFKDGESAPQNALEVVLDLATVAKEGERRRDEWARIRRTIPSLQVTFRASGELEGGDEVTRQLYSLASGGRSLAEMALELRRSDFEVAGALHELCMKGALAIEQVGDEVQAAETVGAIRDLLEMAAERLQENRYEGAFEAYEAVLALDRLNQVAKKGIIAVMEARKRERARRSIPLTAIPVLRLELAALSKEDFDPQEAFLLTRLNGQWDVQSLLKLCPMAEEDALLTMARLLERRVIELRS